MKHSAPRCRPVAIAAALLALGFGAAIPAEAQTPNPLQPRAGTAAIPSTTSPAAPATKATKAKSAASGDFKARRTQCSQQWKAAKAANTTGGDKWPQFFSKCNTRLKAQGV